MQACRQGVWLPHQKIVSRFPLTSLEMIWTNLSVQILTRASPDLKATPTSQNTGNEPGLMVKKGGLIGNPF